MTTRVAHRRRELGRKPFAGPDNRSHRGIAKVAKDGFDTSAQPVVRPLIFGVCLQREKTS